MRPIKDERFWLAMAAKFDALAEQCVVPMRAERQNPDGTIDVIPDVNRASADFCRTLAEQCREGSNQ